ncbi:MAG: maleylacetoacetate isomerase [Myxococcales bacterium]|nr:maleylacetoacetate isomerase [Myxococcales bacterium]
MSEPALILHNYWRSSASYRVRIALGLKGLAYRYQLVHIIKDGGQQKLPAYRSKNPMAQVPTLEVVEAVDAGAAPVHRFLPQSLPIIEYLEERWPTPPLLPADPYLRARTRALAELVNSGIQPLQNLSTTRKLVELGGDEKAWLATFIGDGLAAFAASADDTRGRFCVGDSPSIADCFLIPQLYSARRFGIPYAQHASLVEIEQACAELPAFAAALPEKQPDAVP